MKDNLGGAHRRPAHRFRIAPAPQANLVAEFEAVDFEEPPRIAGDVELVLARVDLILSLISLNLAIRIDDVSRNLPARISYTFHTENDRNRVDSRPLRDDFERAFLLHQIE